MALTRAPRRRSRGIAALAPLLGVFLALIGCKKFDGDGYCEKLLVKFKLQFPNAGPEHELGNLKYCRSYEIEKSAHSCAMDCLNDGAYFTHVMVCLDERCNQSKAAKEISDEFMEYAKPD